jgi:lipopolysaccharide export LptBFGC system permease protein LptF
MYFFSEQFVDDLAARLTGAMSFRFILQPAIAVLLGIRDGLLDARAGTPPFIADLLFRPRHRARQFQAALHRLLSPILVAIVLDAIAQHLIFHHVRPVAALLVGTFVMGLPYALARGFSNRLASAWRTPPQDSATA